MSNQWLAFVVDWSHAFEYALPTRMTMSGFLAMRRDEVRTLDDLRALLERFPDDKEGNRALAVHLWGYQLWTRAEQLRGLVRFLVSRDIGTLDELRAWAARSRFEDFEGQVRGLGPAVYQWLVMRLGVETVKPDVRLMRFVSRAVGRPVGERETIEGIEQVARRIGVKANELDWAIWGHMA